MRLNRYAVFLALISACAEDPEPPVEDPGAGGSTVDPPAPGEAGGAGGSLGTPAPGVPVGGAVAPPAMGGAAMPAPGGSGGAPPVVMPPPSPPQPPAMPPRPPGTSPQSIALYDESKVIDLFLTFPPGEWEKLLNRRMVEDDTRWARCSFTFEGQTYPEAHCRRKGTPEIWDQEKKPQMIVRFNFVNKQGRFRGLRRLNLEYFDGTDAPIRDRLGFWVMREAGLPAPRANHARVFKDGQQLGLYTNIEAVDKEFLEDHFGAAASDGNLWESGWDLKTNEEMRNATRLEMLTALVQREPLEGDHTAFYAQLDALADIDEIVLELAAETAALTDDNFSNGAENFFYYEHPERGFLVLPWDLDTIYSAPTSADVFAFWEPSPNKLRQLINQHPAWRAKYVDKLVDIRDRVLTRMAAKAQAICDQVAPYVAVDVNRRATYNEFLEECAFFQEVIPERIADIKKQLGR